MISITGWNGVKEFVDVLDISDEAVNIQYADGVVAKIDKHSFLTRLRPEAICELCLSPLHDGKCALCDDSAEMTAPQIWQ